MSGLFGGGKSAPPPAPKAGDAITVVPGATPNTETAKRAAVGAAGEEAKKATTSLLGDETSTLVGNSTSFG